ncbi:MAG: hypothetical protein J6Q85_02120, partial [Clostridia bacterium]|nr:hypothetical protein [Clostridia bacterium]
VKKGRARFISESMICLACPPRKMEENEMSNTQNKFDNLENLIDKYVSEQAEETTLKERLISAIEDEKFLLAIEVAVKNAKISTSLLQRKLNIGYGRAAYMIDAMEALGLIGAPKKLQPREVLPAAEEYLAYKSK